MRGIDISDWQRDINAGTVPADFVIVKATEGIGYVNPSCDKHIQQAIKAGRKIGVYHFARNGANSAAAEAAFFLKNIRGYVKKAILVLDWEDGGNVWNVAWAKQFLDIVQKETGVRPMIYMSESVVNAHDWSSVAKADYGLWVARYRDYAPDVNYDMSLAGQKPSVRHWAGYAMWQWTSSGRLSGYGGNLDLNEFYGDAAAWDKYAGGAPGKVPGSVSNPQPQPSKPAPAPSPRKSYVVRPGDSLSAIASAHGLTLATVKALNPNAGHPAGNFNNIYPGDVIVLTGSTPSAPSAPAPAAGRYVVVPSGVEGYLGSLAARYGSSVGDIVAWNKAKYPSINSNYVQAGWYIRVK